MTDRCDLRCVYCMAEDMAFLPRRDLLALEELDRVASAFIARGVTKLRITGGEPLVRRGIIDLLRGLSRHLETGALGELTLTTNGTQLARYAADLAALGIRRVNVSLDSRNPERYAAITRGGRVGDALQGIDAARQAGLAVKINAVALKAANEAELPELIRWAHCEGMDITLIEVMPLGETRQDRSDQFLPLSLVRERLAAGFTLVDLPLRTGGPARYVRVEETGGRLGFITPLTHNFCESCNRVRVTCTGTLFMCLGKDAAVDLRTPLRSAEGDDRQLFAAIDRGMLSKPRGHDFVIDRGQAPALARHMSVTGG